MEDIKIDGEETRGKGYIVLQGWCLNFVFVSTEQTFQREI